MASRPVPYQTRDNYNDHGRGATVALERGNQIGPDEFVYRVEVRGDACNLYGECTAQGLIALWKMIPRILDVPGPPPTVVQVELTPVAPRRSRKRVAKGERAEIDAIKARMTRGQR